MSGPRVASLTPLELLLLPLLPLLPLLLGTQPQGSPGPLQCYSVGPLGILNCSWESLANLETPPVLYHQSQKYHSNRTQEVKVPSRQSWVTIPREQYTMADKLLIWATQDGQPLWSPVFVNLETQMKPDMPSFSDVEISEDEPLEATVLWEPPPWPTHKVLICQFQYKRCQEKEWTQLEPQLKTDLLTPVEMQNLEPGTSYQVSGRCRVESGYPWGEWSPDLSFLTPFLAPEDLWVSGTVCETSGKGAALLLWKDPGPCVQVTYRVWFGVGDVTTTQEEVPCCKSSIPALMEWAVVSTVNTTNGPVLTNLSLVCLAPESAPHDVVVRSIDGSPGLLVTWRQGTREPWEYVVDWARDGDSLDKLSWIHLPTENLSASLPGDFEGGVPYRITVTAAFPEGLAAAPSVWGFTEELVPLAGPAVWRLQDDPSGTPAVAWGEVPRHQLRGQATHYTLCIQGRDLPTVCMNVSCNTQTVTLPSLHWGSFELWVMVSTVAGQGPPGPSLWLHLPDNGVMWKILPWVLSLWGLILMGCGLSLATSRCPRQRHKLIPQWIWERVPDPANSNSGQPYIKEVSLPQPPKDGPILEVEEMELEPIIESPPASAPLHSGYEKHFLPTPEELGLGPPAPRF
ncbi:interleukin-27 receptor subunit alpha isoform X1 [Peromyscus californicus insignis]|uniref:interleukin-27 receptor subunit alpha isoform X1 n=1 Tax=Peromyscus californicus insignis TaxID=564181 RepID=UPI0022A7C727|nr:interleukin-27 receptor subunit alpha isoform X1 [Peromyscus californicus insignis]